MLGTSKVETFVGTTKPQLARHFYETILGLTFVSDEPYALLFDANGVMLRVSKVEHVAAAPYTVLGWVVQNIQETVRGLKKKGVLFERYPYFEQDESGIWSAPSGAKVAWFKDPDGNLLSVSQ